MRKRMLLLVFLPACPAALAQQTWIDAQISKEAGKKLEFFIAPQIRFDEGFSTDEYFLDGGMEYKLHKYLKFGTQYRLGNKINKNNEAKGFGRFAIDAKTSFKWNNFEPGFRLRFTNSDDFADDEKKNYLRYKFGLEYHWKNWNLKPYAAFELYQNLTGSDFDKRKYEAGVMYKISKHHQIGSYWRVNENLNKNKSESVIGISYKLNL
ncbi:MAG: DUF2490 domain-containing protein [Prolixibacteraceae bacterium]